MVDAAGPSPPPVTADDDSVFAIRLSRLVGTDYLPMFEDIIRMVCIQLTIQLMIYLNGGTSSFFSADFVTLVMYIVLGVMLYWLVYRKLCALK